MPVATQSRITNRDLFALTLRYAMENDLAIERYAKYKGERTPSLFGDDDKPTWITVGAVDHHGGHPVQIDKKTGKMLTGHFAGMTLSEAFGPVGKKHAEDRKKTGIESNEKLPLFDQASKVFEESPKKPPRVSQWADSDKASEWEESDEFQHVIDTTPRLKAMDKLAEKEYEDTIMKGDYPDGDGVPTGPLGKKLRQAVADEMVKRGMEVPDAAYKVFKMNKPSLKLMDKKPESSPPEKPDNSPKAIPFRDRNKFASDMLKAGKSREEIESAMVSRGVAISDARMHSSKAMGDQAQSVGEFAGAEKEEAKPQKDLSASDRDAWMKQQASDAIRHNKQGDESRAALKNLRQGKSGAWWGKLDGMNSEEILKAKEKLASNPPKHAGTSSVDYDERDARDDALRLALRIKEATKRSGTIQSKIHPSEFAKWEKLLDEASTKKPESGIVMPSQTIPNDQAKAGDQLGLFGDATKAKVPAFKPKLLDQPKQGGLFDTKGNPDQMDLFGDGVMPDDMVYKPRNPNTPKAEPFKPKILDQKKSDDVAKVDNAGEFPDAAKEAGVKNWKEAHKKGLTSLVTNHEKGMAAIDSAMKPIKTYVNPGIATHTPKQFLEPFFRHTAMAGNAETGFDRAIEEYAKKSKIIGSNEPMDRSVIDERQIAAKAIRENKKSIIDAFRGVAAAEEQSSRPEAPKAVPVEEASNPKPKAVVESPSASHSEKAFAAADIAESKGSTPRQVAKAAQDQLDKDYEFARASDVRNAGEDLKGSARHRVNAWKGLQEAEKDGTAEKLVNREGLHRLEPHDLMTHADKNPLTSLAMHYALRNFPPAPAGDTKTHTAEKNREQYLDAYRAIKEKANELAASTPDHAVGAAVSMLKDFVSNKIRGFRGQNRANSYLDSMGIAASDASDKYNPTANLLVKTHNALSASTYKNKNGVMGRLEEFSKEASEKYGNALTSGNLKTTDDKREFIDNLSRHAKDVIEGQSLNKTFGKEVEKRDVKRFDPSEAYVKIATRNGGRDLSKLTADPVKAVDHMVKEMGMRGVQWGNSVTDDERKHHAGKALEAITDLADVTGLHPKDIALDGKLGLAIGARGKGTASAHYEPGNKVINLTRANGVGTLAHEWGHAFDHMLNGFGLETTHKGDKVVKKGGYMSNDTDTHEIRPEKQFNDNNPWVGKTSKPELHAGMIATKRPLSEIREAYRGLNEVSKGFRDRLKKALQEDVNRGKLSAKNANDYWNSDHEIFARSFEQHVMHKMKERGIENTYLSGMSKGHKYWPTPEESKAMAPAFDKIFEQYRKEKHGSSDPIKYSAKDVAAVFTPILLERYSTPEKPFIDDGDLLYDPIQEQYTAALSCLVERYDWNSSQHPRDAIGRFTKTRELPSHPDLQRHHSLHMENQKPEMTLRLRDFGRGFRSLLSNASRKSEFNGGDQSEESIWENIDKTALRALLEKTNQADHASMKGDGPKFHELINANQLIPKMIAERLHGGSRFFDPTKLRGRWNEPNPKAEQAPQDAGQQETAQPAPQPEAKGNRPGGSLSPRLLESAQQKVSMEDGQTLSQATPLPSPKSPQSAPEPQPKASKPKRAPITSDDLPKGISKTMSNRLEKSIKALIGDNPEAVKEFKGVVIDAWKHLTQEVSDHNQAFRQITGGLAPIELMKLIDSARKQTLDYSKKKNFDIMADTAQRGYPGIIGADAEEGLSRLLETGIRSLPKVTDPEVAERAVALAGPDFFRQFEQGEAPEQDEPQTADDWNDQFSWAVARVMVERYRREAFPERYAGKDQMTFNWDEAAHPREPKGANASKGGEFTKKQSPAVKPKGATLKDGYVLQPRAKAGGEHSDVDGKFYKGGALMPVHGLFSGMEKPPAKEKRFEGTAPIAKEDQDKQPRQIRQRSSHEVEAERERMEEQRKWGILQAGPISDLFGWIGDRPNSKAFQRSPGHKLWAPFAEKLGTDGVEKLTKFMKEKTLAREPNPAYANNVEWQINNDQHFHTKKHIKAVPNSRLGEIWLGEFIPESSLDDKLELNDKLKELLGGKEKYSHNPTQAQREAGNYKMQHIRVHGLPISIETPKGKKRNPDWPSLAADYGYFKNTLGKDGDHIDVFVGPDKSSEMVFVIDQVGLNGKFDEHKVLLGFANQADAVATYRRCYHNGWKVGPVTAMTIAQFKNWLASGKHSRPIGKQVSRYSMFAPMLMS